MPIPIATIPEVELFPRLSQSDIDACRTSAWYDTFEDLTLPAVFVDLEAIGEGKAFMEWLESPSIFMPEDSQGRLSTSSRRSAPDIATGSSGSRSRSASASSNASSSSSSSSVAPVYHLPKTNQAIRDAMARFGGSVFPKLNWTAPQDAAFLLPQTGDGPLCCDSPADVYLLLKSSDLIWHDLDSARAYQSGPDLADGDDGPSTAPTDPTRVELVLKRFENVQPSREFRCFVRNDILIGITQRDMNYYDHLQADEVREGICNTIRAFWEDEIRGDFTGGNDYVFDLYLSSDLRNCMIVDFNPYRPSTDPLLFTYPDLFDILNTALQPLPSSIAEAGDAKADRPRLPILRIIDSRAHPEVNRAGPSYGTNMMPGEMVEMSQGRSLHDFTAAWQEALAQGMEA